MISSELSTVSLAPSSKDLILRKSKQSSRSQITKLEIDDSQISSPEDFAKCFKFYAQFTNPHICFPIPYDKISAKTLYKQHKSQFQLFFNIFRKFNIKIVDYIVFFISELNKHTNNIDEFFTKETFQKYIKYLDSLAKTDNICNRILQSSKFAVEDAKKHKICTFIDYFKYLVSNKLIAPYFMTGKLSPYFLALIVGFKKVIPKLDYFSKEELSSFYERFDSYALIATNAIKKKYQRQLTGNNLFEYFLNIV